MQNKTAVILLALLTIVSSSCKISGTYFMKTDQLQEFPRPPIIDEGGPVVVQRVQLYPTRVHYAPHTLKFTLLGEIEYRQIYRGCCPPRDPNALITCDGRWKSKADSIQIKIPHYTGEDWYNRKISNDGDTITLHRDEYVHTYYVKKSRN